MDPEREVQAGLAGLREEYRALQAPAGLDRRVLAAYRMQHGKAPARGWMWVMAVAATLLAVVVLRTMPGTEGEKPVVAKAPAKVAAPEVPVKKQEEVKQEEVKKEAQRLEREVRQQRPTRPRGMYAKATPRPERYLDLPQQETMTPFVAVPGAEMLPPAVEATLVRARIPGSQLRRYGFDAVARQSYVNADFVVGQDGLARAVRVVQ